MTERYTQRELRAVVRWLKARAEWLHGERMLIECGDDFAHSNGKWPGVVKLQAEEQTISASLRVARDQLDQLDEIYPVSSASAYLDASKGGETEEEKR